MNKDYWYVGQKVSDQRHGNGEITKININENYSITVSFLKRDDHYSINGKSLISDSFPSLSPYPHVPIKYNKIFKKGDVVKYKNGDAWYLGIYDRFVENKHLVSEGFNDEKLESVFDCEYVEDENILKY